MTSGEEDFTQRARAYTDHRYIKGVDLITPTVEGCLPISIEHIVRISHEQILGDALRSPAFEACVPCSIENDAIAYDSDNDRFKVDIQAWSADPLPISLENDMTRELGIVDLSYVLGSLLDHSNPVIARLTDGSDFIDPRDVSDRAARELGIVYGNLAQLLQRASTYDLIVQLRHNAVEIDPRSIRALTNSDVVSVEQSDQTKLKATVTQAAKDRTISSVDATATAVQISNTFAGAGNYTVKTPASGKKIRLKFISLELSAAVDLGYRFAAAGTIYYLRTTAGPYVSNLMGCNNEGAADEALILNASGACTVKGYALYSEV
jgi:hypothetical protein